jgi:hypothetical protein
MYVYLIAESRDVVITILNYFYMPNLRKLHANEVDFMKKKKMFFCFFIFLIICWK